MVEGSFNFRVPASIREVQFAHKPDRKYSIILDNKAARRLGVDTSLGRHRGGKIKLTHSDTDSPEMRERGAMRREMSLYKLPGTSRASPQLFVLLFVYSY